MKIVSNIMHPTPDAGNAGLEAAVKAATYWNSKCVIKQSLYRVISGMPLGTMANSMRAENWGALTDAVVPMYTDEESVALQTELGKYLASSPESTVADVVHVSGDMPSAPTDIISQTGGAPTDNLSAAAWMIDMSAYLNETTGLPNAVIQTGYGVSTSTILPGSMAIIVYQGSTAEHDEAADRFRMDEGYLRRMSKANDYFDRSSFFNILLRKLI